MVFFSRTWVSNIFQKWRSHCTRHTTFAPEPRQQSNWLFHRYSLSNILAVWWRNYDWWWLLDLITKKKKEKKRDEKRRKYDCQQKEGLLQRSRQSNQPSIFFRPFPSQTSHQCTHATARTHTSLRMLGVEHRVRERERRGGTVLTANDQWSKWNLFSVSPHPPQCDLPYRSVAHDCLQCNQASSGVFGRPPQKMRWRKGGGSVWRMLIAARSEETTLLFLF